VDASDVPALAEMARLDPDLLARTGAVRALAEQQAGGDVANRLRDLWTAADEPLREDIAMAWTEPAIFHAGGREALRLVVGGKESPGAIEAAAALELVWPDDAELRALASALVVRGIEDGPTGTRLHAIAVARLDGDTDSVKAIEEAADDDDEAVQVAALARMLDVPADRARATTALRLVAGHERTGENASRALMALAGAGDLAVQQWIEDDLAAKDPYERLSAATALAALGRPARAAPLLADADPMVRARAACTLVMATRRR
jgi:hypothetical protein